MIKRLSQCMVFLGLFLFFVPSLAFAQATDSPSDPNTQQASEGSYERARVEHVGLIGERRVDTGTQLESYTIRFLSGPFKNQTKEIKSEINTNPYKLELKEGDLVVIFIQNTSSDDPQFYIEGFDRQRAVIGLILLFIIVMILLAGWQGFKVVCSIGISILLIGYVLIPLFLKGVNPVPVAIVLGGIFTLISTGLSTGWNRKSYVTVIGTIGGALVAYLISILFAHWSHLNGLSSEEDRLFFNKNPLLNPTGLMLAGIIIASVGVVEDVAVSIASGVAEVRRANPRMGFRQLFQSGMVVGNDHMGALANTLIYAYVGASLSTLLLYKQFGGSWLKFVNFDSVVEEIVRSLSGTIGLVFTVPITALLAAWVMQKTKPSEIPADPHPHVH